MACWPTRSCWSFLEQVGKGGLADAADGPGGELHAALAVLDQPGLFQHFGQFRHLLEALGRLVAQQLAGSVDVHLGQRTGIVGRPQQVVELIQVAQFLHHLGRRGEVERIGPAEVV